MSDSNAFAYTGELIKKLVAAIAIIVFLFIFIPNNSANGNAKAVSAVTNVFNVLGGKNTTHAIDHANELKTYGVFN